MKNLDESTYYTSKSVERFKIIMKILNSIASYYIQSEKEIAPIE